MVVYLVGAGPGDPELVTIKAHRLIKEADALVYDRLVHLSLVALTKPGCLKYYAGKMANQHHRTQEEINELLVNLGSIFDTVVRLKGGDPFLFGRGGEEAEVLVKADIPYEIVPGVSSALAVPAYAGIPVTHRSFNSQFAIVTGRESKFNTDEVDFEKFPPVTIILMGTTNRKEICRKLRNSKHYEDSTPAAIISNGTLLDQQVVVTTIEDLEEIDVNTLSLIVVGEVVTLKHKLEWFDRKLKTLKGKKIIITGEESRNSAVKQLLVSLEAEVLFYPFIDLMVKRFKIPNLNTYDVFVFTSRNGVKLFCAKYSLPLDKQYFAIGSTTQKELEQEGVSAACPEKYTSIALGELLQQHLAPSSKILLVRSANASSDLRKMLEKRFFVKEIAVYEVVPQSVKKEELEGIDAIFITAGSVARALEPNLSYLKQIGTILVSIGPMTSKIMAEIGIEPDLEARTHTIEGMVRALIDYFNKKK